MKPTLINNHTQLADLLSHYARRRSLSNNYLLPAQYQSLIQQQRLSYVAEGDNLALLVQEPTCDKVYYHINDTGCLMPALPADRVYAMEIPFRGDNFWPQQEMDYWERSGFSRHQRHDLYVLPAPNEPLDPRLPQDVDIHLTTDAEDVHWAINLFNDTFDPYAGDYINLGAALGHHERLLVAFRQEERIGALHYTVKGTQWWISHVAVIQKAKGTGVGTALVRRYINKGITEGARRFAMWVLSTNFAALKMYEHLGFTRAGKATISMIRPLIIT